MKLTEEMIDQYDEITETVKQLLSKYANISVEVKDLDYDKWWHYKDRGYEITNFEIGYEFIYATVKIGCGYGQDGYSQKVDIKVPISYLEHDNWIDDEQKKYDKKLERREAAKKKLGDKKKRQELLKAQKHLAKLEKEFENGVD